MKVKILISFGFLIFYYAVSAIAQDSLKVRSDTTRLPVDSNYIKHRANKAALFSAIIPGAGQIYNRKYWKPPILYAGFIALGYSIAFNNKNYQIFKKAYQYRIDTLTTTVDQYVAIYPDPNALLARKDYYRRTRDLMWIISSGVYILNIIDAYVDAQLSDFDISDDLTMNAQPGIQFAIDKSPVPSLALTFRLK
ncbi:MAG: DUF5683 domain-containing protein [Bacteroidota bacterium]